MKMVVVFTAWFSGRFRAEPIVQWGKKEEKWKEDSLPKPWQRMED